MKKNLINLDNSIIDSESIYHNEQTLKEYLATLNTMINKLKEFMENASSLNPNTDHYIAEGTDLNSIIEIGTYKSTQTSVTSTLKNVPSDWTGGFILYVISYTSSYTGTVYRQQEIHAGGYIWIRYTGSGGSTWSAWRKI